MSDLDRQSETARGDLADPAVRARKLARLDEEHVRSLNELVRRWRTEYPARVIPWFDPDDGGTSATTLLLMEAPGPRTAAQGVCGLCSEDNTDPTAREVRRQRELAGLSRGSYVKWNVVPWALVREDGGFLPPKASDLTEAEPFLLEVVSRLPALRLIITAGTPALTGWTRMQSLHTERVIPLLAVPHPSQRNTTQRSMSLRRLGYALAYAASLEM